MCTVGGTVRNGEDLFGSRCGYGVFPRRDRYRAAINCLSVGVESEERGDPAFGEPVRIKPKKESYERLS